MDISNLEGRVAVVTGAASGIGRETALLLARHGADLAICDLNEAGLKDTAERIEQLNRRALQARVDVADSDSMGAFADRVFAELGRVDVLVNNAGIGTGGPFVDVPLHEWDTILGVNLKGVVNGCHVFLPRMIEARHPAHVINIASMAGYIALPGMSAYSATKFAVIGLSESLRAELAIHQIGVTAICPGLINTAIVSSGRSYGPDATDENRERGIRIFERRNYGPDRVAKGIVKAIQRNRAVAPVSPEAWFGLYVKRFAPGLMRMLSNFLVRAQEKRRSSGSSPLDPS